MRKKLWINKVVSESSFRLNCDNFYKKKTFKRVNLFLKDEKFR